LRHKTLEDKTMYEELDHMLWRDHDGVLRAFARIAKEQTERDTISPELYEFWQQVKELMDKFPFYNEPLGEEQCTNTNLFTLSGQITEI